MSLLAQPLSAPLQNGLRFFHTPIPAIPSACLTACFPPDEENYGLTTFRLCDNDRLGLSSPPTVLFAHDRKATTSCAHCFAFWLKPDTCAFSLVLITAFIGHSHMLTILPNSSPFPSGTFGERTDLQIRALAFAMGTLLVELCKEGLLPPHIHLGYYRWDGRSCHGCAMQDSHKNSFVSHRSA